MEISDDEPEAKPKPKPKPKPKTPATKEESPRKTKASPKKPAATKASHNVAAISGGATAESILATIPDAILPDVDPSKKFNYKDFMAKKEGGTAEDSGDLEIPDAALNCLAGLVFVFTGIMPSLPREKGQELVKRYGGKVTSAPSRNTSVVVLGSDAGPKKIQTIKTLGIKAIDQDGFLLLLSKMPADGGSGVAAQKAMEKKAQEEKKIEADSLHLKKLFEEEDKKRLEKAKEDKLKGKTSTSDNNVSSDSQLWTDKYAPKDLSMVCGNKTSVNKLNSWLKDWRENSKKGFKIPGRDGYGIYRAAILHGPPGIGKTTAAHLIAQLQGWDVIESNASDVRSKGLIMSKVAGSLDNTSLEGFFYDKSDPNRKSKKNTCYILDEVDGMSAGDRGGVGAMAQLCRTTQVPLILICNERTLPKMRPFDRVTLDIPFRRPDASAIRSRIMTIAHREGLKVSAAVVDQLVESTRSDIRQILNLLSSYAKTSSTMDFTQSKDLSKASEKNILLRPFDIVGRYMSGGTWAPSSTMTLNDKMELYFHDHDFAPLMVQENYLNTAPARAGVTKGGHLELAARAAESISDADLVDKMIHGSQQQWSLMPLHAVMSCVRPSFFIAGQARGRYNFTSLLGNISKTGKYTRQLQEIQSHTRLRISGDIREVRLQYLSLLAEKLLGPLLKDGADGIAHVMTVMDFYYLTKEDWDVIMELGVGPNNYADRAKKLSTQTKSAFTRKYNASDHPVPFIKGGGSAASVGAVKTEKPDLEDVIEEEVEEEEEVKKEDDDDISKDSYIKMAKAKPAPKAKAKSTKGKAKAKT